MSSSTPRLWVVSTPIGNLGDISSRAKQVLQEADLLLAEDTRVSGQLLHRLQLGHRPFLSLHAHNEQKRIPQVLSQLEQGKTLALLSSAGEPVISDPGYLLVRACRQAGYRVSPVPGPSAVTAALSCSGLPAQPFTFLGFLPRRPGDIRKLLLNFSRLPTTLVFFQRKSRLVQSLKLAYNVLGPREACLARELTKEHEELISLVLGQWDRLPEIPRGEFTVVLAPAAAGQEQKTPCEGVLDLLQQVKGNQTSAKELAREVSSQVQGWSTKEVYNLWLRNSSQEQAGDAGPD
ncbi:MAG: 16S rRNA (cytidine(1402)-2'-O)-methyltransferase [Desulfohalobiaceae bacterium]